MEFPVTTCDRTGVSFDFLRLRAKYMENFCDRHYTSLPFSVPASSNFIGRQADDVCEVNDITGINCIASSPIGCSHSFNDECAIVYNDDMSPIVYDISVLILILAL
jgi:hypothetical protein